MYEDHDGHRRVLRVLGETDRRASQSRRHARLPWHAEVKGVSQKCAAENAAQGIRHPPGPDAVMGHFREFCAECDRVPAWLAIFGDRFAAMAAHRVSREYAA